MSHLIYKDNCVSVREPCWHGIGHVPTDYLGREEMMKLAGHDFTILEEPLYVARHMVDGDREWDEAETLSGWKGLRHSKDGHIIHVAKDTYEVIQNDQLWDILDEIMGTKEVKYETAGTLKEGAVLWAMARLDEPIQIKGDDSPTYPFITVSTSHDQTGACKAMANAIRVVCWNTYSAADAKAKADGLYFVFRHTKNVKEKIAYAKEALGMVRGQFKQYHELMEALADMPMSWEKVTDFIADFIPMPPEAMITERVKTNILTARAEVVGILNGQFNEGMLTVPAAHQRTAYGVWCACTEYLDHYRGYRTQDTYFKRSILDPSSVKLSLANKLMEVAA